jgi:hypothetical protein
LPRTQPIAFPTNWKLMRVPSARFFDTWYPLLNGLFISVPSNLIKRLFPCLASDARYPMQWSPYLWLSDIGVRSGYQTKGRRFCNSHTEHSECQIQCPVLCKGGNDPHVQKHIDGYGPRPEFWRFPPFDSRTAIVGGADRPVTIVAKKAGCYTYSVGACTAGSLYGMCGDDVAQFIVSAK